MELNVDFKPLGSNVLVGVYAGKDRTDSGLYIPENVDLDAGKPVEGVVAAIGPEVKDVQIGDDILFGFYSGNVVKLGKQSFLIVPEKDIFGITQSKEEKEGKKVDPKELRSVM